MRRLSLKNTAVIILLWCVISLTGCGKGGEKLQPVYLVAMPIATEWESPGTVQELCDVALALHVNPGSNDKSEGDPEAADDVSHTMVKALDAAYSDNENQVLQVINYREVKDGKMQSYLTGEWKDADVVTRRNFAIMIPNNRQALPQTGISYASVIYEAPVEGRITRLMAIFEDYDDLDHVGPVRSSRDYYISEALSFDSIYCNWGLARPWVEELINSDRVDNISQAVSGIYDPATHAFDRISRPGYGTEFTGYMFIKGYRKDLELKGYRTQYEDGFKPFTFAADDCVATYEGWPDATKVYPGGTSSNKGGYGTHNPVFKYNDEDGLYYRSQYGIKHVDGLNSKQIAVSNIIFKVCTGKERLPNDSRYDYLAFGTLGTGDAYVFTSGKVIKGTWERDSDLVPTTYYDDNGREIVFNQGKTWICCIWDEYAEYMMWE